MVKYTKAFDSIMEQAMFWAAQFGSPQVEPEHIVYSMIRVPSCRAYHLLQTARVDINAMDTYLHSLAKDTPMEGSVSLSRAGERLMRLSTIEADLCNDKQANSAHLLLGILRERVHKPTVYLKEHYNLDYEKMAELYENLYPVTPSESKADIPIKGFDLAKLGLDKVLGLDKMPPGKLVSMQIFGADPMMPPADDEIGPEAQIGQDNQPNPYCHQWDKDTLASLLLCGRQSELKRIMHIMNRLTQNNPLLIGASGVGKRSLVQLLAQQHVLHGKYRELGSVYELDYTALVAGASYKGQFEMRMKSVMDLVKSEKNSVLFIPDLHNIMDGGRGMSGGFDGAGLLKIALQEGKFRCIATTTPQAYSHWIESDTSFASLFQQVRVEPPTAKQAFDMLHVAKSRFERHHHVLYTDDALRACIAMSERYMTQSALPAKAFDVMDETGVMHHTTSRAINHLTLLREQDVAQAVSAMTGVPTEQIRSCEMERLVKMEETLNQQVLGQQEAIHRLTRAIIRSRMGMQDSRRPIGSFFFLGSTGVGKTYLAQCLAEQMFGSRDALIRIDMSEYKEKHTISLLVGAPPGYVGYENGGKLTEAVKQHPYSIVLLDEIEKAHPDVFNLLLQVLDEGRLTDRQGRMVDFRNTIIIMTSNVGTRQLSEFGAGVGFDVAEMTATYAAQTLRKALEKTFPPEFINRVDDIITFAPLSKSILMQILHHEIAQLQQRMRAQSRQLTVGGAVEQQLFDQAYDPKNGARPIRRAIQTYLEEAIIQQIMANPTIEKIKINKL